MAEVAAGIFRRVERKVADLDPSARQRGWLEDAPLLVAMAAAAEGLVATGHRRGRRIVRVRGPTGDLDAVVLGDLCAQLEGFNLQAATRIGASDRQGLERMARYLSRPPIANARLSHLEDGRLELQLKRPWRDGTTAFRFTAHELIERVVAQVPRPNAHLARYHDVLAPAFAGRSLIVPANSDVASDDRPQPAAEAQPERPKRPTRFPWASLIWRVFLKDVLECARCAGRMEIVADVTATATIARILDHMGQPVAAPTIHPPRPPPQTEPPFEERACAFEPDLPFPDDFAP